MPLPKSVIVAARSLRRNRLQTALTVLGMTIGVGTVITMIAVGSGAQRSITGQVRAAGMNIIVVTSGNYRVAQQWMSIATEEENELAATIDGAPTSPSIVNAQSDPVQSRPADNPDQQLAAGPENLAGRGAAYTLTLDDARAIAAFDGVQSVSGGVHDNISLLVGGNTWTTQLRGEQATLPAIRRVWVLQHGRFFTPAEDSRNEPVAVLGSVAAQHLFADANPVGRQITLRDRPFRIIGVIASDSWMVPAAPGDGQFDAVYIPVGAAQQLLHRPSLDTLTLATVSTGQVTSLMRQVTDSLRQRHALSTDQPDDFTIASQAHTAIAHGGMRTDISRAMTGNTGNLDKVTLSQLAKTLEQASRTMSALLTSIAAVSLVVGGIGIMNIMLLSVTERTREIGIRRAVGARANEVMRQFLLEAIALSIAGGLLGIALGVAASLLISHLIQWSTELSWLSIALSFTISAAIGIVFGYYPARQASRVTPMTSLRHE